MSVITCTLEKNAETDKEALLLKKQDENGIKSI